MSRHAAAALLLLAARAVVTQPHLPSQSRP